MTSEDLMFCLDVKVLMQDDIWEIRNTDKELWEEIKVNLKKKSRHDDGVTVWTQSSGHRAAPPVPSTFTLNEEETQDLAS